MHCDSGSTQAYFGNGTKLTVLGKKNTYFFIMSDISGKIYMNLTIAEVLTVA